MNKDIRKKMSVILAVILALDTVFLSIIFFTRNMSSPLIKTDGHTGEGIENEVTQELFSRVSFVAVGDNLIHAPIYNQAAARATEGYDFSYAYENIADMIKEPDVAIINQETIISSEHNVSSYPLFNSPQELGDEMIKLGFDVFNISTNHSLDCGEKGLISAINYWKERNVVTTGAYLDKNDFENIPMNEVNGIKIAYLGFTEYTNGLSLPSDSEVILMRASAENILQERIMKAKETADAVIVNAHWGEEYTHEPNAYQRELAEKLASWGADVIIGTHPHVIQPVEYIINQDQSRTLVAYSLGNFISAQDRGSRLLGGVLNFDIVRNNTTGDISLENVRFSGVVTHYGYKFSNLRVYKLEDYTDELSAGHGVKSNTSEFSVKYLNDLLKKVIDSSFLK